MAEKFSEFSPMGHGSVNQERFCCWAVQKIVASKCAVGTSIDGTVKKDGKQPTTGQALINVKHGFYGTYAA